MMTQPLIVVEDDDSLFRDVVSGLDGSMVLNRGWGVPPGSRDAVLCCVGDVRMERDAESALEAALAGFGIVAHVPHTHGFLATFVDDLGRVGHVDFPVRSDAAVPVPALATDQKRLLDLLAEGRTIAGAARELHLSLRTTNRRLASVRLAVGARSTAEAVHIARRLGLC